jgi:transcription-repair coupling factor (superfamily II helicase)
MSEVQLTSESMRRFRQAYVAQFGAQTRGDTLYEAISEGRRHPGMEHWLSLFFQETNTLFEYVGEAPLFLDHLVDDAAGERLSLIKDYYDATGIMIGMKPAGGISTSKLALHNLVMVKEILGNNWLTNDWFRFGASSLANDVLMQIMKLETGVYQSSDYFTID